MKPTEVRAAVAAYDAEKKRLREAYHAARNALSKHERSGLDHIQGACPHKRQEKIEGSLVGHKWLKCKDCRLVLASGEDAFTGPPDRRVMTGN